MVLVDHRNSCIIVNNTMTLIGITFYCHTYMRKVCVVWNRKRSPVDLARRCPWTDLRCYPTILHAVQFAHMMMRRERNPRKILIILGKCHTLSHVSTYLANRLWYRWWIFYNGNSASSQRILECCGHRWTRSYCPDPVFRGSTRK